jgi:hypothetical protein
MKNKKYHSFGTIPRYHLKIADRGKMIDTPYTQIGDRSLSCRGVGTSIQSDGVQLVIYNNVYDYVSFIICLNSVVTTRFNDVEKKTW